MTNYWREILGDMVAEPISGACPRLPSPNALRGKILLKVCAIKTVHSQILRD